MKNLTVVPVRPVPVAATTPDLSPPIGLCAEAARLWQKTVRQFELEPPALVELGNICEALTCKRRLQRHVRRHGSMVKNRFGEWRLNEALAGIARADATMSRGFRALKLDLEPIGPVGRPGGS